MPSRRCSLPSSPDRPRVARLIEHPPSSLSFYHYFPLFVSFYQSSDAACARSIARESVRTSVTLFYSFLLLYPSFYSRPRHLSRRPTRINPDASLSLAHEPIHRSRGSSATFLRNFRDLSRLEVGNRRDTLSLCLSSRSPPASSSFLSLSLPSRSVGDFFARASLVRVYEGGCSPLLRDVTSRDPDRDSRPRSFDPLARVYMCVCVCVRALERR